jgi:hypothetical protein
MDFAGWGSLLNFPILEISMFYRKMSWIRLHVAKRLIIIAVGLWLALKGKARYIREMAFILLVRYIPTSFALMNSGSRSTTILDNIFSDLFSLCIPTLWIIKFGVTKPAARIWSMIGPACAAAFVADAYYRTSMEVSDIRRFEGETGADLEYVVTGLNFGILIFCYFTHVFQGTRIPAHPDRKLDMATYSMFIAKISQMADDLISRARFLNCTEICLDMRMFSEIAFIVLFELKWRNEDENEPGTYFARSFNE